MDWLKFNVPLDQSRILINTTINEKMAGDLRSMSRIFNKVQKGKNQNINFLVMEESMWGEIKNPGMLLSLASGDLSHTPVLYYAILLIIAEFE
jgi:hypothetical protein